METGFIQVMTGERNVTNKTNGGDFPYAPDGWAQDAASNRASEEGIETDADHWAVVRALHEFFARHDEPSINSRKLHDALEEKFHPRGGMKYLFKLFPGGPVTQGCRLAGLEPPAGADKGFGSVQ
jgi:TusE/DsrC/DsvC family sulfur relay protein